MWEEKDNALVASLTFENFVDAFSFMTAVAIECEKMNHHPNWSNVWNQVHISLSTHDAGNVVTEKDRELASIITELYNKRAR